MNMIEIENKSFAELKAARGEIVEALKSQPVDELASRYLQARMDARQRDEKLDEQGKTIVALQDGLASASAETQRTAAAFQQVEGKLAESQSRCDELATQLEVQAAELAGEKAKVSRLVGVATRNLSAMSQSAKTLNDALSGNAVDAAVGG